MSFDLEGLGTYTTQFVILKIHPSSPCMPLQPPHALNTVSYSFNKCFISVLNISVKMKKVPEVRPKL